MRDRELGTTERVNVDNAGGQGDQGSFQPAISEDGRFVAFTSFAALGTDDSNGVSDVFLHDRSPGAGFATVKVSVGVGGEQADGGSAEPTVTSSGDVAFSSDASNLVAEDTNAVIDVFLRVSNTQSIERISIDGAGAQANGLSHDPALVPGMIAFRSTATNLVTGDTNRHADVFVRDLNAGTIERVGVGAAGAQANGQSAEPVIGWSPGPVHFVAFSSTAANLVAGDTNGTTDVFVHTLGGWARRRR